MTPAEGGAELVAPGDTTLSHIQRRLDEISIGQVDLAAQLRAMEDRIMASEAELAAAISEQHQAITDCVARVDAALDALRNQVPANLQADIDAIKADTQQIQQIAAAPPVPPPAAGS